VSPRLRKAAARCRQAGESAVETDTVRERITETDKFDEVQVDTDRKRLNYNIVLIL